MAVRSRVQVRLEERNRRRVATTVRFVVDVTHPTVRGVAPVDPNVLSVAGSLVGLNCALSYPACVMSLEFAALVLPLASSVPFSTAAPLIVQSPRVYYPYCRLAHPRLRARLTRQITG
jgi:hypothetical protein